MKLGLVQISASDDPNANLPVTSAMIQEAADQGAELIVTPEVTNCVSIDRARQADVLRAEDADASLAAFREIAATRGFWLLIGSLALLSGEADGRFVNRSFLIGPDGEIRAHYDKIHMFDVTVSETEIYRESAGYRPGTRAVRADTPWGPMGLSICYDLRFPALYRALAQAGASFLTIPAAFSPVTGAAHWGPLLRARAIETGCFVIAPAQTGTHGASSGRSRATYGHSMVIGPWGDVLLDAGTEPGVFLVEIEPAQVADARQRIPSLHSTATWTAP